MQPFNETIGLIGLGTMGANLARNAACNGATVAVFNRTAKKTDEFMKFYKKEGNFIATKTLNEFIAALPQPRTIILMVKAGDAVDAMINELVNVQRSNVPTLSAGDIIIDAGNSHYKDTNRRESELKEKGIRFIGMGISGGEEGALNGPSMMPGGDAATIEMLMPLFAKMAADDGAKGRCVANIGPDGAGHFVKMVHNGIEYGLMQLIAESYHALKELGGLNNKELAAFYSDLNATPMLKSFLVEITAKIFTKKDDDSKNDLIDVILDKAGQKGTGAWTTDAAMSYGVAIPIIASAVDARIISGAKDFRVQRSAEAPVALIDMTIPSKDELVTIVQAALEVGFCSAYAEGFLLMSTADKEEKWNLTMSEIARIWRGGCIIRSGIVERFQAMFCGDKKARTELREFCGGDRQKSLRQFVALAVARGIPTPSHAAAIHSYDAYRTARLPQNLTQAQRDFFGAHAFERTDKAGSFHAQW